MNDASAREPDAIHGWIAIAMRSRKCVKGGRLYWEPVAGAPVSVQEPPRLADARTLLLACRYQPERVDLVVRLSAATLRYVGGPTPPQPPRERKYSRPVRDRPVEVPPKSNRRPAPEAGAATIGSLSQ